MKRQKLPLLLTLLVLLAVAAAAGLIHIDRIVGYGGPPAGDYDARWDERGDQPDCGYSDEVIAGLDSRFAGMPAIVRPGGGGGRVTLGAGTIVNVFDSASPATLDEHDILIVQGFDPRHLRITRSGPDLMICGRKRVIQTVLIRQYCRNNSRNPPWNNEIEEIVFPEARESWLADALYDSLPAGTDFPGDAYRAQHYNAGDGQGAGTWAWTVRPFRDTLPGAWLSSIQCRLTAWD